jgi:pyruvate/2-oxoacid:ferredoxin oxidoreductase beta subunit
VINEERPEESFKGDPHEACAGCGQPLYTALQVVYDSPAVEEGGGGYRWP